LIEFHENYPDLPDANTRIYYASNLPEAYKTAGLEVHVLYRQPNYNNEDEVLFCILCDGGDDYPQIWITSAE